MPREGSAASRGYGYAHRKRAAELKGAMRDGDPCARCGKPMYRSELGQIHGDHVGRPMAFGGDLPDGLSHASCNTRHGARLGNRLRGARRRTPHAVPRRLPEW
jgi:hypothetical protein